MAVEVAKRLECEELAPAFVARGSLQRNPKRRPVGAVHTLARVFDVQRGKGPNSIRQDSCRHGSGLPDGSKAATLAGNTTLAYEAIYRTAS